MTKPCLQVENLRVSRVVREANRRPRREPLWSDISFAVAAGEHVAIWTERVADQRLLRAVAMLQRLDAGRVYFEGEDLTRLSGETLRRLRQRLQYVGGDPRYLLPLDYTVAKALLEPLKIHGLGAPAEQRARIEAAADLLGVSRLLLDRKASSISPGLRQRVALARAFTLKPRLLLCDDLIDRLEGAAVRPLLETVAHACRAMSEPAAWVWTTADRELAQAFSDRVLCLENGRLTPGPG
jgi:ABC-type glutathione transport system ATPase component